MQRWYYRLVLGLILLALLACTAGCGWLVRTAAGEWGLLAFFLIPAVFLEIRAVWRREPRAWLWFLIGALLSPFVWAALPGAGVMALTGRKTEAR